MLANLKAWAATSTFFRSVPPLLAVGGLTLIAWTTARPIVVLDDGGRRMLRTHARTVAAALRAASLQVGADDWLQPSAETALEGIDQIELRRARSVQLSIDQEVSTLRTPAQLPANIMRAAGVRLLPGDRVWVNGLPYSDEGGQETAAVERIRIDRGSDLPLRLNGAGRRLRASRTTAAELLLQAGVSPLYEGDRVVPGWSLRPSEGQAVRYLGSEPTVVEVDGGQVMARTAAETVGEALEEAGVALLGLDRVEPAISAEVPTDRPIRVTRVREEVVVELEPVPFETTYQPLPEVEIDNRRILDTGAYGVRANQVRLRYEDGEQVERQLEGNWLAREPEPRVLGYGTDIVVRTASTADGTIEYWRAIEMWATSYSPSRAGVSPAARNFGITASGKPLEKGLVAIDRNLIPFGTRMYVPGYGFAEAADTGSGVRGRWIDLGYDDDNYRSWAQYVTVYFLTPVPPANNIVWIFP